MNLGPSNTMSTWDPCFDPSVGRVQQHLGTLGIVGHHVGTTTTQTTNGDWSQSVRGVSEIQKKMGLDGWKFLGEFWDTFKFYTFIFIYLYIHLIYVCMYIYICCSMNPCKNSKHWGNTKHQPLADFAFSSIPWRTTRRFQERQTSTIQH